MQPGFAVIAIFLPILMMSVFAFVSIAAWSDARRREREAFYQSETLKKVTESPGPGGAAALDIIREQARIAQRRIREGQKVGGLITAVSGIGVMIFLRALIPAAPIYLAGVIPLLVGAALLAYSLALAPKD